jgi:hypothetical protein
MNPLLNGKNLSSVFTFQQFYHSKYKINILSIITISSDCTDIDLDESIQSFQISIEFYYLLTLLQMDQQKPWVWLFGQVVVMGEGSGSRSEQEDWKEKVPIGVTFCRGSWPMEPS